MFTTNQLIQIFQKSGKEGVGIDAHLITKISQYVKIASGIDFECGIDSYCFKINLLELSKSGMPDELVYEMADNGWKLSKDRRSIEFFC